jgi:membrane-associated phospholipid phosphatase
MKLKIFWTGLTAFFIPTFGLTAVPETVQWTWDDGVYLYSSPVRLNWNDWPATLAVTGLLGGSLALDRITRRNLMPYQDSGSATTLRHYGDVAQFAGPIAGCLFAAAGWTTKNEDEKRVSWDLIESFLWANAISETFKFSLGRHRPYATDDPFELRPGSTSGGFPSGHTISAFATATTLSEYYPTWEVAVPAYAAATAVGFSRIYANQHWGSDVVGGALLGYGVSHTLWKRHHSRAQSAWELNAGPDGIQLTRKF